MLVIHLLFSYECTGSLTEVIGCLPEVLRCKLGAMVKDFTSAPNFSKNMYNITSAYSFSSNVTHYSCQETTVGRSLNDQAIWGIFRQLLKDLGLSYTNLCGDHWTEPKQYLLKSYFFQLLFTPEWLNVPVFFIFLLLIFTTTFTKYQSHTDIGDRNKIPSIPQEGRRRSHIDELCGLKF